MFKGLLLFTYKIIETLLLFLISSYGVAVILFWEMNPSNWGNESLVVCRIYILLMLIISIVLTYQKLIINKYWSYFQLKYIFKDDLEAQRYYNNSVSLKRFKDYIIENKIFYFKDTTLCRFIYGYGVFSTLIGTLYISIAFMCWDLAFWNKAQYVFVLIRILTIICIFIAIGCVHCSFREKVEETFFITVNECVNEKDFDGMESSACYAYKLIRGKMLTNINFILLLFEFYHNDEPDIFNIKL